MAALPTNHAILNPVSKTQNAVLGSSTGTTFVSTDLSKQFCAPMPIPQVTIPIWRVSPRFNRSTSPGATGSAETYPRWQA